MWVTGMENRERQWVYLDKYPVWISWGTCPSGWFCQQLDVEFWSSRKRSGLEIDTCPCHRVPWGSASQVWFAFHTEVLKYLKTAMASFNSTPLSWLEAKRPGPSHHCSPGGQSSLVVESFVTQSVVCGPAASPGGWGKWRLSNSLQIYGIRVCILTGSPPTPSPHDACRALWFKAQAERIHTARVFTLALILIGCVGADCFTSLWLGFFFYQVGIILGLTT